MNESALEGFVKIVELNSFSAAAEALYLSQSALSQQIRTLEGQLQFELFQHVPRRVVLTPAGQDFYPKAKQLTALYQEAVRHARAVQQQEKPPERHLVIAWSHEAMRMFGYDLFSLTNELCLQYTSIMMQCASRSEVWRSLKKGDADLSFQLESAEFYAQGFTFIPLLYVPELCIPIHPPADMPVGRLSLEQALQYRWLPVKEMYQTVYETSLLQEGLERGVNFYAGGRHPQRILWGSCAQDGSCSLLPQTGSQLCAGAGLGQGTPVRHRAGTKARGPVGDGLCPRGAAAAAVPLGKAVRLEAGTGGGTIKKRRKPSQAPTDVEKLPPLGGSWHRAAMTERVKQRAPIALKRRQVLFLQLYCDDRCFNPPHPRTGCCTGRRRSRRPRSAGRGCPAPQCRRPASQG